MRSSRVNWPVLVAGLVVATNVHAQSTPPADSTASSVEPLPPAPPPPPQSSVPSDSAAPLPPPPAPPPSGDGWTPDPAMVPPGETVPVAPPVAPKAPIPVSPGPSIWGPAAERKMPFFQKWYGWKTLVATVPADALLLGGVFSTNNDFFVAAMVFSVPVHVLAGPINHWVHGYGARGAFALGANILAPILGVFGGETGMAVGYFLPPLLDAAFSINFDKVHIPSSNGAGWKPSSVAIVPMLEPNRKGLSIVGQF